MRKTRRKVRVKPPKGFVSRIERETVMGDFVTAKRLAAVFGISERSFKEWVRQNAFPRGAKAPGGSLWSIKKVKDFLNKSQATDAEIMRAVKIAKEVL
nr:MAG TPA: excisionase [Caudoviricetes sp.]